MRVCITLSILGSWLASTEHEVLGQTVDRRTNSDAELAAAVDRRLSRDPIVPFDQIELEAKQGIVTLTGKVDHLLAHDRAIQVTRETRGVRGVIDRMDIRPSGRTDVEIRQAVITALKADAAVEAYEVEAQVDDGTVILTGNVQSWAELDLAEKVVRSVTGVRQVRNRIKIRQSEKRSDAEIAEDVRGRLRFDRRIHGSDIDVSVKEGKVTLTGTVASEADRWLAYADAWVAGVTKVNNSELEVDPTQVRARAGGQTTQGLSDAAVMGAVRTALRQDPRVDAEKVRAVVIEGVVTLTGVVENHAAKWAANDDAKNTVGVEVVRNYLKVRGTPAGDNALLRQAVKDAIARDPLFEPFEIDVGAYSGRIYLMGEVDTAFHKERAEQIASRIKGVTDVRNLLVVSLDGQPGLYRPRPSERDRVIQLDVKDELEWSPYVEADGIDVTVRDGIVTLEGTVDNRRAEAAAEASALAAGARSVVNNLKVQSTK